MRARVEGETLILAEPLVERVLGEGAEIARAPPRARSWSAAATRARSSTLTDREPGGFPVLAGDFVTTEDGTGLVHIAPAFGEDDYAVAAENGIFDPTDHASLYNPVGLDGTFDERVVGFEGRFVKDPEVTRALIDDLAERGLLFREQVYEHAYPHCWRCGTPLLYYAKSSWYVAHLAGQRPRCSPTTRRSAGTPSTSSTAASANGWRTTSTGRSRATATGARRCRSGSARTRAATGASAPARSPSCASAPRARSPTTSTAPTSTRSTVDCEKCGGEMRRVESVIDTWYDSGAMPFAQFHYPFENEELFEERFPADFICEAIDQTRGWFYTLLAESTLLFDTSSYRNCVCLGLILDPEGQKMSKSKGNVVEPWDVISAHGADAFRWYYLTAQQPWSGYRFSVDTVGESVRQFLLTLWNTYSFWVLYANAEDLAPEDFDPTASAVTCPR